ncbi:MAG: alpha-hydroxy-acid oxidizing protein [Marmoricola sp.]|nr:alpha-hydroxy-acid oxidizing protein [Marmoricola sp.]
MTAANPGRWLDQVESLAREALPAAVFRYVAEGAREEITLGEAEASWRAIRIAPHILRDVLHVETSTRLLGTTVDLPLGIAPMTLQRAADPEGEVAMARAAALCGVPVVVSSNAGSTFADIASTGATWWLQLYVPEARQEAAPLFEAAVAAGAAAVVLTADAPVLGTRYRSPEGPHVWEMADASWVGANAATVGVQPQDRAKALDLGPADIAWLASATGLPVAVKGVLRPDDAAACVAAGASAVWVSNHGGRQLDQAVATAGCVAAVRAAVGEKAQVYVDGGVRSGLHALLGVSLGADAVFVGRPMFHALAAGGSDGVVRALAELGSELVETMRLCGASTLGQTRGIASPDRGCGP